MPERTIFSRQIDEAMFENMLNIFVEMATMINYSDDGVMTDPNGFEVRYSDNENYRYLIFTKGSHVIQEQLTLDVDADRIIYERFHG